MENLKAWLNKHKRIRFFQPLQWNDENKFDIINKHFQFKDYDECEKVCNDLNELLLKVRLGEDGTR